MTVIHENDADDNRPNVKLLSIVWVYCIWCAESNGTASDIHNSCSEQSKYRYNSNKQPCFIFTSQHSWLEAHREHKLYYFSYMWSVLKLYLAAWPLTKPDLSSLDFTINRVRLYKTNSIEIIKECQQFFNFSVQAFRRQRVVKSLIWNAMQQMLSCIN